MKRPRDWHPEARIGRVGLARFFSNVVSPPVMFAVLGLLFALAERPTWGGFLWAAVYGLLVSLTPILLVLYLLRTGRIRELHMSDRRERRLPYVASVVTAGLMLGLLLTLNGPELLRCLAIFNVLELAALAVINDFWLISIHATGITSTVLLSWLVLGPITLIVTGPMLVAVVYVRLYLKRHTVAQLVAGAGLGVLTVLSLTLFGCFV